MRYFLSAILIFSASLNMAQTLKIGPRIGGNLMPLNHTSVQGTTYSLGINAGLSGEISVSKWFAIRVQPYYTQKKKYYEMTEKSNVIEVLNKSFFNNAINLDTLSSITSNINDTAYKYTKGIATLSYFEIPLMAVFKYKSFDLAVGPSISFLTGAKTKEEMSQSIPILDMLLPAMDTIRYFGTSLRTIMYSLFPGYQTPVTSEKTDKTPFTDIDYGIHAELTYHMPQNFYMQMSYNQGFNNYRKTALKSHDVNKVLMLSLGYNFGKDFKQKDKARYDLEKIPVESKP